MESERREGILIVIAALAITAFVVVALLELGRMYGYQEAVRDRIYEVKKQEVSK